MPRNRPRPPAAGGQSARLDSSREHVAVAVASVELPPDPLRLLHALRGEPLPWMLESALVDDRLGGTSMLGADPFSLLTAREQRIDLETMRAVRPGSEQGRVSFELDPFEAMRRVWPRLDASQADLPVDLPFVGGAIGVLGYELAARIESVEFNGQDDLGAPDLTLLLIDRLLSVDHASGQVHAVTLGFGSARFEAEAAAKAALGEWTSRVYSLWRSSGGASPPAPAPGPPRPLLAAGPGEAEYVRRVEKILCEIERGNVYEVNLTQRLTHAFDGDPLALYAALRHESPAPFAAYIELPELTIVSSSPERFLKMTPDDAVESRPIKGTRPRGATPEADAMLAEALVTSPKDRAENLMIVDLVRNDLGRVCVPGSVRVPELMQIERYATVFHLVSKIVGRLRSDCDAVDLIRAAFPPGSMTGAPKIAAMRIAADLEPVRRGIYSGALGYLDVRGGIDLSVVIRTCLVGRDRTDVQVGGAVVADSDPHDEWTESLDKARALLAALDCVSAPASK